MFHFQRFPCGSSYTDSNPNGTTNTCLTESPQNFPSQQNDIPVRSVLSRMPAHGPPWRRASLVIWPRFSSGSSHTAPCWRCSQLLRSSLQPCSPSPWTDPPNHSLIFFSSSSQTFWVLSTWSTVSSASPILPALDSPFGEVVSSLPPVFASFIACQATLSKHSRTANMS